MEGVGFVGSLWDIPIAAAAAGAVVGEGTPKATLGGLGWGWQFSLLGWVEGGQSSTLGWLGNWQALWSGLMAGLMGEEGLWLLTSRERMCLTLVV